MEGQFMRRVLLAGLGALSLAVLSGSAKAADLAYPYQPPINKAPIYAPVFTWTGFYVGINGGYGFGRSRWDSLDTIEVSGGLIGGTGGYNYQYNQFVFGVEGDLAWSGIEGDVNQVVCPGGCNISNDWLATVRGRAGYAFDRFLPYLTAGFAIGNINATLPALVGVDQSKAGWTIGAGLEFGVTNHVSFKADYLYVDLGSVNCGLNCGFVPNGDVSFHTNVVRGGVNFRF
jgi:outer membrane immunogenic protein